MSDITLEDEQDEVAFVAPVEVSSEEPSMTQWSSLLTVVIDTQNEKHKLFKQGLYSPGSGDICPKYICQSDSSILKHPYYNYPAVLDPGIKEALLEPEEHITYSDDGRDLYIHLCSEMNICPVRMFHKQLLNSELSLSYYGVNPRSIRAMAMALQRNEHVKKINLTENFLTDDSCFHLGQLLNSNITLQELNLTGCRIGASGLVNLGEGLPANRTLVTLNLSVNELGDEGGTHYAYLISLGTTVKNVNLSKNHLGRKTALAFVEAYEFRDPIIKLDLSWNVFNHVPSTVKMLSAFGNSEVLQEINLSFNALEGERVAAALYNILLIPTISVLDLSHNRLHGESIDIITKGLINAKKLVTLDLSFNPMTTEDAEHTLQKMLRPKVKLQNLLMKNVPVEKNFLDLLERVSSMKSRKDFKVVYGDILHNWQSVGQDPRTLLLKRAEFLGKLGKRKHIDILVYFLTLYQQNSAPIPPKVLSDRLALDKIPLRSDYVDQLGEVFPGPRLRKVRTINLESLCEYIHRLYPEKKVPEPVPEVLQVAEVTEPPPKKKAKQNRK